MDGPSILLLARESAEVPARALVARVEHLVERGWEVSLVCDEDPDVWRELVPPGLAHSAHFPRRRRDPAPARPRSPRVRTRARTLRRASDLGGLASMVLATQPPDLLHLPTGATALAGAGAAGRLPSRLVVTLGGDDLRVVGLDDPVYYDPVWSEADALHVADDDLAGAARARGCPDRLPVAVIRPAVDPAAVEALGQRNGRATPLRVLSAAPLEWTQGHEHALRAVRLLLDDGVACEYRLVGGGPYGEAVAFARHQLGLQDSVELIAPVSAHGLREHLAWADAYVHAAVVAGPSAGLIEAQAAGLPAVVSDAGGAGTTAGKDALVAPRRDPEALAGQLATLAADPGLRRRLGERGAARARERCLADQLEAFERLYRSLLGP